MEGGDEVAEDADDNDEDKLWQFVVGTMSQSPEDALEQVADDEGTTSRE